MLPPFDYLQYRMACSRKQTERAEQIAQLPPSYREPLTAADRAIVDKPLSALVNDVHSKTLDPLAVLRTYGKVAVRAHARTNCLTEILIQDAEAALAAGAIDLRGPLAGVPVSLKDTLDVAGHDTCLGYSALTQRPTADGGLTRLLRALGAVPYVKTNVPTTLLSFESANAVWGRTTNPHRPAHAPGGSSGGEAALLALGGRVGVGSDVAGSVRLPAHWSGCYALRCAVGRWPKSGGRPSMPGQEGVPAVCSPMARTLGDLVGFTKAVLGASVREYDHTVIPLKWREDEATVARGKEKFKIGVMYTDGVVDPTPACRRALDTVVEALESQGHTAEPISPPSPFRGLVLASVLLNADGCTTFRAPLRTGEPLDPGARQLARFASLPRILRWLYALYVRYVQRDPLWATLLWDFGPLSAAENWAWVAKREAYRAEWHAWWAAAGYDFLLTPPNATPAVAHGGMREAVSACGYTFLFNLLDYTAAVLPVTHVDRARDALPEGFKLRGLNGVARGAYGLYDAERMHGLPVGVQVVGRRLEEERVLGWCDRVEDALERAGGKYTLLELD